MVLIDPDDRVLLLWHSRPQDQDHWAPPGGGVEPGESLIDAASRELYEEVGLAGVALRRPVWTWQHRFSYFGTPTVQHETIFACRLPRAERPRGQAGKLAADGISAARWWTLSALDSCADDVWPYDLAKHARELLRHDLNPVHPRALASPPYHPLVSELARTPEHGTAAGWACRQPWSTGSAPRPVGAPSRGSSATTSPGPRPAGQRHGDGPAARPD